MAATSKSFAVVSCHVERILDDRVWTGYRTLLRANHGGFAVASLVRPPDESRGEDPAVWLDRVRELRALGPVGHHTHWTSPEHARPLEGAETGERVLTEAAWLRGHDIAATCFCGGGWFTDASVAAACASLGYVDCTPLARRPPRLESGGSWAELAAPAFVETGAGPLLAIPTTHSLGELVRLALRPQKIRDVVVHGYFHDTDLLDPRRRRALAVALAVLGRRRTPGDLDTVAAAVRGTAAGMPFADIVRGRASGRPE
jgi:hypothetical protein